MKRGFVAISFVGFTFACASSAPGHVELATPQSSSAPVQTVTVGITSSTTVADKACIAIDAENLTGKATTLDGRVDCGQHSHPNGSMYTFCVVKLDAPRCVTGMPEQASVDEVQLAGDPDFTKLVGQHIHVAGEPFPEHTAWHARPVLMMVKTLERR